MSGFSRAGAEGLSPGFVRYTGGRFPKKGWSVLARNTVLVVLLGALVCSPVSGEGQLDASPALFSVLAAINAAGYDSDLDSPGTHPLRLAARRWVEAKRPPVLKELREFFALHRQRNPAAELSQYISFALSTTGPPDFKYRFPTYLLPPDAQPLDGFEKIMKRFHEEAEIGDLWRQSQPAIEQAIARYHEPVSRVLLEANGYLRNPTSETMGRRFQVFVELLGAPNIVETRSYADDYFVVVTPSAEPRIDDIRYACLMFLLDPLALRNSELLNKKRALLDYVLAAPALADHYKKDFLLLATASLATAVEARLAPAARRAGMVDRALREGYILTPHFAEKLPAYEAQEQSLRFYYPELIKSIDLWREEKRLANVEFVEQRHARKVAYGPAPAPPPPTGAAKTLSEADELYRGRDLGKARELYLRALKETDEKPLHAKSYYGLARIAVLKNDPELAERLFQKTLELAPEPQDKAWALVYLGRLAQAAGERERALEYFKAALDVKGASAQARQGAEQGVKRNSQP